jgi:kinase, pfkB family
MEKKYDLITSGYVSMDHLIQVSSPISVGYTSLIENQDNTKIYYGGCGLNIAVAVNQLGFKALPVLRVGGDWINNGFKSFLESREVPLEGIQVLEQESTSTSYLIQDSKQQHITLYYPGAMDKKYAIPLEDSLFQNSRIAVMTVASKKDNQYFLEQCKKYNLPIVFGMKDDFDAFPVEFLKEILCESQIIFLNEQEKEIIEKFFGCSSLEKLFDIGKAKIIIVTLGEKGSVCYEKTENGIQKHHVGVGKIDCFVDATGAGDAYMAGFLYGYLKSYSTENCLKLGTALSSFVIQEKGCCMKIPNSQELEKKGREIQ